MSSSFQSVQKECRGWIVQLLFRSLNYILWLQDLLDETMPEEQEIAGIDIGVGASCIYPLLGCATRSNWKFMGTGQDIDERSIQYARKNVMRNHLEDRIKIKHNDNPERILLLDGDESSREEIDEGLQNKELEPSAVCTGTDNEMITTGGEYGFIKRMINESLTYKTRIKWYTSMMGQKKTIKPLVDLLKSMDITNYVVTEFCQGRTKRWGIAWSFDSTRVVCAKSLDSYRPKSQFSIHFSKPVIDVQSMLKDILNDLDITFTERDEVTVEGEPVSNTWSRAARRQKKLKLDSSSQLQDTEPLFAFRFEFLETADCEIRVSWMRGKDRAIFESFWNHIKKRLEEGCGIIHGSAFAK
ncbi:hypothetical protein DFQ30_003777 [Apophysomyces sp. BC1015]|nr:hypothetical protein DFQ30_003777 [Apophysomyces sp. BC1015]KAG0182627.1 hypothetical protein DFQ29_003180 [Apophysomyces sp. BC1021]